MTRRTSNATLFLLLATLTFAHGAFAAPAKSAVASKPTPAARVAKPEVAIFGMGCFWSAESQFEQQPGVLSVVSGFDGGREEHPSYEQVSEGGTGHYESVQVTFDPAKTNYARLLDMFWHGIDPTQGDGQFCDRGPQYRSVVFALDERQRKLAEDSKRAIEATGVLHGPIVTQILPATRFWPAEEYHQDFAMKNPAHYHAYRVGCGRDRRLAAVWGDKASKPLAH